MSSEPEYLGRYWELAWRLGIVLFATHYTAAQKGLSPDVQMLNVGLLLVTMAVLGQPLVETGLLAYRGLTAFVGGDEA